MIFSRVSLVALVFVCLVQVFTLGQDLDGSDESPVPMRGRLGKRNITMVSEESIQKAKNTVGKRTKGKATRAYCPIYFYPVWSRSYCRRLCRHYEYKYYSLNYYYRRCYCCNPNSATTTTSSPTTTPTPAPTPPPSSRCKCGVPQSRRNRIVGGQPAEKNEYPWQVALVQNGRQVPFCGGTLLSSRTVLTAAHCRTDVSQFMVHVGEHDITAADGEQKISPSSFTPHPSYNSNTQDNDFAIITLFEDVTFSDSVMPACLPDPGTNYDSRESTVTGWGLLAQGGNTVPRTPYEVDVDTLSNTACTTNTQYSSGVITGNMICATNPGKDACQGDSGGPLITLENNYFSLIGVVSWGYGCAQPNAPGVYARVTSQLGWIEGRVQGSTCEKP